MREKSPLARKVLRINPVNVITGHSPSIRNGTVWLFWDSWRRYQEDEVTRDQNCVVVLPSSFTLESYS